MGYRRPDGTVGVRNHVIVINSVAEVAGIVRRIADAVPGVVPVTHQHGYAQFPEDREQTVRTLVGNAANPNVAAALFIGLGGEEEMAHELAQKVQAQGRKAHALILADAPNVASLVDEAAAWLRQALAEADKMSREKADVSELIIGLECGGSDAWSGVTANPALGVASDIVVGYGGTVILSETTEAIGAEHILARQAATPEVAQAFLDIVAAYEARMLATGEDVRSANPSPGNVKGGLTTLDEKSLGCIKKGGSTPLKEVVGYAYRPKERGFVFMDTPGYDVDSVCGMTAGGAQIVVFTTGRGSPTGSPIVPVIKVSTNTPLYRRMPQHIDVDAGVIIEGKGTLESVGREIFEKILAVASGEQAAAEMYGHKEFSIWRLAQTI